MGFNALIISRNYPLNPNIFFLRVSISFLIFDNAGSISLSRVSTPCQFQEPLPWPLVPEAY